MPRDALTLKTLSLMFSISDYSIIIVTVTGFAAVIGFVVGSAIAEARKDRKEEEKRSKR